MLPRGRPSQKDNTKSPLGRGNTFAVKHSLHGYRRMLSGGQLDARTAYKVLGEKAQELVTPLGGDPSPQEPLITADTRQDNALCRHTGLRASSQHRYRSGGFGLAG